MTCCVPFDQILPLWLTINLNDDVSSKITVIIMMSRKNRLLQFLVVFQWYYIYTYLSVFVKIQTRNKQYFGYLAIG